MKNRDVRCRILAAGPRHNGRAFLRPGRWWRRLENNRLLPLAGRLNARLRSDGCSCGHMAARRRGAGGFARYARGNLTLHLRFLCRVLGHGAGHFGLNLAGGFGGTDHGNWGSRRSRAFCGCRRFLNYAGLLRSKRRID